MSDKPLVQQRLAADLANLVLVIQATGISTSDSRPTEAATEASLHFIAGFWEAMVREWAGIDRLR
jgi:ribosomal RNA-processing protein 1